MKKIGLVLVLLAVTCSMVFAGAAKEAPAASEAFKVAFVYIGPPGDLGWTYMHDQGRLYMEEMLGDAVETTYIESVEEGPDSARIMNQYAGQGYDMIFTTSFGYMDYTLESAIANPDVLFEHCSGYKTADNMSTYFGRMYQPRYLSGMVAGSMTKSDVIGYVAAFPIPEVIRGINAFTLGAQSVNPDVQVRVVWTYTWYDPVKEREAAIALLDAGADILAQHQDTTEPPKAAKERGMMSIGYDADMRKFVGDSVLVSPVWNWGPYYASTVQAAIDGTWETHQFWGGLTDNAVKLSDFSPLVPADVQAAVKAKQAQIESGAWDVFTGPIMDQSGAIVVPAGQKMDDGAMLGMSFFVKGVVGKIQ